MKKLILCLMVIVVLCSFAGCTSAGTNDQQPQLSDASTPVLPSDGDKTEPSPEASPSDTKTPGPPAYSDMSKPSPGSSSSPSPSSTYSGYKGPIGVLYSGGEVIQSPSNNDDPHHPDDHH